MVYYPTTNGRSIDELIRLMVTHRMFDRIGARYPKTGNPVRKSFCRHHNLHTLPKRELRNALIGPIGISEKGLDCPPR